MSFVTGIIVVDAPASALNNAGKDDEARTDNAVAVKFIRTPEGRYPYVSAQAVRFWLRTGLANREGWTASPVFRETKVAYTDAEPTKYAEDDLFGYMRAASKSGDEKKAAKRAEIAAKSTPVDEKVGEVTRVSPLRVGTLVSVSPVRITQDFGTMARADGDPVPHEHQFYRAHLEAPFAVDLTAAGTFFAASRVGYKNIDSTRIENAKAAGATQAKVRGLDAWRLPFPTRSKRVGMLLRALGTLEGGAKQALHYTDAAPSVMIAAICRNGHQPFLRAFRSSEDGTTVFRADVFEEVLKVYADDLQSEVFVGWAKGFLDAERVKLEKLMESPERLHGRKVVLCHPREAAARLADAVENAANSVWFD